MRLIPIRLKMNSPIIKAIPLATGIGLGICVGFTLFFVGSVAGQSSGQNEGQVLVLKNGNVLRGFVERTPAFYSVHSRTGNRLDIQFDKVELVADSLPEVYWRRLSALAATNLEEHESLFFWCIRYELWPEAANQLEILEAIETDPEKLKWLARRLQQAKSDQERRDLRQDAMQHTSPSTSTPATAPPGSPTPAIKNDQELVVKSGHDFFRDYEPIFTPLPSINDTLSSPSLASVPEINPAVYSGLDEPPGHVVQVEYLEVTGEPANEAARAPVVKNTPLGFQFDLSARELDQFIKTIPKNGLARFRGRVEPLLIANCTQCHHHDSKVVSELPLMFRGRLQPVPVRMSERNLYSSVHYIDSANPTRSRLLQAALTPHGGQLSASFVKSSNEYNTILNWIQLVSGRVDDESGNEIPTEVANQSGKELQSLEQPRLLGQQTPAAAILAAEKLANASVQPSLLNSRHPNRTVQPPQLGERNDHSSKTASNFVPPTIGNIPALNEPVGRFVPKDEFDPEIFNRQFHDERGLR